MVKTFFHLIVVGSVGWSVTGFTGADHQHGISADQNKQTEASFDIVHAKVTADGQVAHFHMAVSGKAGQTKPTRNGQLAGSNVFSYVWPTSLNSNTVGFADDAGLLALAVTAHPDFDDTPLYDENGDNNRDNDGNVWHSHWVVLQQNPECGAGALAVVDIAPSSQPRLPKTWPGLPILIDSPGWQPLFTDESLDITVAFDASVDLSGVRFDGVTAGLRVNQSVHAPLLCVAVVNDIASGDLSLPGVINR